VLRTGGSRPNAIGNWQVCFNETNQNRLLISGEGFAHGEWKHNAGMLSWVTSTILGPSKKATADKYSAECHRLSSGAIMTIRYSPKSAIMTTIECCVYTFTPYSIWSLPHSDFREVKDQITNMIADTERLQEKLLATAEQVAGLSMKAGSFAVRQCQIDELLKAHSKEEQKLGSEIHPASQRQYVTPVGKADDKCKQKLNCPLQRGLV
jgi:hypothetical protein